MESDEKGPLRDRVVATLGISDGGEDEPWVGYFQLAAPERASVRYDPKTGALSVTVSPINERCESDLRRFGVGHRVGVT
jgi:hypothetical protein